MPAYTQTFTDPGLAGDGVFVEAAAGATTDRAGGWDDVTASSVAQTDRPLVDLAGLTDGARRVTVAGATTDVVAAADRVTAGLTGAPGGATLTQALTDASGATDGGSGSNVDWVEASTDAAGARDAFADVAAPTHLNDFAVRVDWRRDGTFTQLGDDVTGDVRGGFSASYGRDQSTSLSSMVAGRGTVDLDNTSRRYSARNTTSPIYPNVKPARPVLITRNVGGATFTIFRGHTDDQPVNPDLSGRRATLNLVDYLADFRGVTVTTPLYQGLRTGQAIERVLDAVGWTGVRRLDAGATVIPWWWCQGNDAADMLGQLLASEGPPALLTIDASGAIVFRDRHHRLRSPASTTPQATMAGGDAAPEPRLGTGFTYTDNWGGVVNAVNFSVDERRVEGVRSVVWSTEDTIYIRPSGSYSTVVVASDPYLDALAPTEDAGDFIVTSGAVVGSSLSASRGQSATVVLNAGTTGAHVTGLRVRGYSVPVARTRVVTAGDTASQVDYGQRGVPSGLEPVWASLPDAQAIAQLYVAMRAQPLPVVQARFVAQHTQTARLVAVLSRDLSDRVTVVEPETALADDFFVESIEHNVPNLTEHEITLGLEAVPDAPAGPVFVLGGSILGGGDVLAY